MTMQSATAMARGNLLARVQVFAVDGSLLRECASLAEALETPLSELDDGDTVARDGRVLATFRVFADRDPVWVAWYLAPNERLS